MTATTTPDRARYLTEQALSAVTQPDVRRQLVRTTLDALQRVADDPDRRLVVGARRMLCLVALMRGLGVPVPLDRVHSDRFLDLLPPGAWGGLTVEHLDDTLVSGASRERNRVALARLVGDASAAHLVGIPLLGQSPEWDAPIEDSDVTAREDDLRQRAGADLHNQFASVFGVNLVPYFADFAISDPVDLDATGLLTLLTTKDWQVAEVTNSALAGTGARAFSCFPTGALRASMLDRLGDLADAVQVLKIRLFVRPTIVGYEVRFVPIVLTHPLSASTLGTIEDRAAPPDQVAGLLSFAMSAAVLDVTAEQFEPVLRVSIRQDAAYRSLALGPVAADATSLATWAGRVTVHPSTRTPSRWIDGGGTVLSGDDLVKPLIALLHDGKREDRVQQRPTTKMSFSELTAALPLSPEDLSVAIDVANDLGYLAPSQIRHDGVVERGYRAGELGFEGDERRYESGIYATLLVTTRLDDEWRSPVPVGDDTP